MTDIDNQPHIDLINNEIEISKYSINIKWKFFADHKKKIIAIIIAVLSSLGVFIGTNSFSAFVTMPSDVSKAKAQIVEIKGEITKIKTENGTDHEAIKRAMKSSIYLQCWLIKQSGTIPLELIDVCRDK